uniref:Zgc:162331 n=1 Tax=Seriola lalandi dorsalis TaxID=1841481 RepID=A0A3B4XVL5_SERLL
MFNILSAFIEVKVFSLAEEGERERERVCVCVCVCVCVRKFRRWTPLLSPMTWCKFPDPAHHLPFLSPLSSGVSCVSVLPPRRGSFYVESGTGVSVGSVLTFWCREGYQLVGSDKIYCTVRNGKPQWSNYLPVCEAIPRPEDRGLRVAVLASVVSGIVILAMSLSFLICCLQERSSRDRAKKEGRTDKVLSSTGCWLEREEGDWEAFPPPKIFHLSQRMNPRLAPDSPLYLTGGLNGYENRGYQRSQESLLKASLPGLYRSESQLYPHVVLQRVPTPTAPSAPSAPSAPLYLHLPSSSSALHTVFFGSLTTGTVCYAKENLQ